MRHALIVMFAFVLAIPAWAAPDDPDSGEVNPDVVKAVRAVISARKNKDRRELKAQLFARDDLDWASVRAGLIEGPYYKAPMVTEFGLRHSGKNFGVRLKGEDGKERGFSIYIPKSYDAKTRLPVLLYLHQGARVMEPNHGAERAVQALLRFRKLCDEDSVFLVAPYTSRGAEWWMPEGQRLVEWTIDQVKRRFNIDEDRIALMGNHDGGEGVWAIAQRMPGTFSCMMPMTADALEVSAMIQPLYLGTLDRMPVLMGVTGQIQGSLGTKNLQKYLDDLNPMFGKRMKITAAIYADAQNDFRYLDDIQPTVMNWVLTRKRNALANEVDVETDEPDGLRSLWLANDGYDGKADSAHNFPTTYLKWKAPKPSDARKKLGVSLQEKGDWEIGVEVQRASGQAQRARILPGDVILEVGGEPVKKTGEVGKQIKEYDFGTYVPLLLAREVKQDDLERERRMQEVYLEYYKRVRQLEADNEEVPQDLWMRMMDDLMDEEDAEDEEDDEDSSIEISDGSEVSGDEDPGAAGDEDEIETTIFVFTRHVKLVRPHGGFVRADFGARPDPGWRKPGVRIGGVLPGTRAWDAGLREGDVITAVDDDPVDNLRDIAARFGDFKFEEAKEGERSVRFTVTRADQEHELTANWDPHRASRVDARWDKKDNALKVMTRKAKGFTLYFTDELVEPNKEFRLFINGVPYQDLIDPDSAPKYPTIGTHTDAVAHDRMVIMRRKRAKIEGWKPDLRFAVDEYLKHRDRGLVLGGYVSFDLSAMQPAFKRAREQGKRVRPELGPRIKAAYDGYRASEG